MSVIKKLTNFAAAISSPTSANEPSIAQIPMELWLWNVGSIIVKRVPSILFAVTDKKNYKCQGITL